MDLKNEVHCPVCLNIFDDPKALTCLHSLCSQCAEQLKRGNEIKCPVCRESTSADNTKADFKAKRLVEIYQNSQIPKPELTESPSKHSPKCDLCEEKPAVLHCENCKNHICSSCNKAHLKISPGCEEKHCFGRSEIDTFMKCLREKLRKLQTEGMILKAAQDALSRQSESSKDALLNEIAEHESRILENIKQHYECLKEAVKLKQEDTKRITANTIEKKMDKISACITQTDSLANILEEAKFQDVLQTLEETLTDLKATNFEDALQQWQVEKAQVLNDELIKRSKSGLPYIELAKVVDVGETVMNNAQRETNCNQPSTASGIEAAAATSMASRFSTTLSPPMTCSLMVPTRSYNFIRPALWARNTRLQFQEMFRYVSGSGCGNITCIQQLLFVNGDLWLLDKGPKNRVRVLRAGDPDFARTLNVQVDVVTDMSLSASGHVIVTTHSGLMQLDAETGAFIRFVDQGKFVCVTKSKDNTVWALKEKAGRRGSDLLMQLYAIGAIPSNSCTGPRNILKTNISSAGHKYSCVQLGENVFCSVDVKGCVYELSTETGDTLRTFTLSRNGASGYVCRPRAIYADQFSHTLLVLDYLNKRLHVLYPGSYFDKVGCDVATSGIANVNPEACATDEDGQLWLVGSVNNCRYVPQRIYKTVNEII